MSGILGSVPPSTRVEGEAEAAASLARMKGRGSRCQIHCRPGSVIVAGCWHAWEQRSSLAGESNVLALQELVIAADASLYYRNDLAERLAHAGLRIQQGAAVTELILAAYRAWGSACARHLEGDFAFLVWDGRHQTFTCARDFSGRRPLFFADRGDGLLAASSVGAILAHAAIPRDLDLGAVAAAAAGLFGDETATAYRAVRVLPPGHTLVWRSDRTSIHRHWQPPPIESRRIVPGAGLAEGAEELRRLLARSVAERLDRGRPTSVWMSGGWDSTAVFGAGQAHLARHARDAADLLPVSISYPPGDPGREDELIEQVASHWRTPVHWIGIRDIPFFDRVEAGAAARDEPFGHTYEQWNRALARGSRSVGARVALDGVGGDQLFQVSFVYLAELLRAGRWRTLRREWSTKGMRTWTSFLRWVLLPNLPHWLIHRGARLLGEERTRSYLQRPLPPYMDRQFLERHGVLDREERHARHHRNLSPTAYEAIWYLTHPFGGRILSSVSTFALEEGVELRSPLYDRRIIQFALSRPWSERSWGLETKRLLRAASGAWLPEQVVARRTFRTGVTSGYLADSFRHRHSEFVSQLFQSPVLASFGMLDAQHLWSCWQEYLRSGDENLAVSLYFTLQTELWLRAQTASHTS